MQFVHFFGRSDITDYDFHRLVFLGMGYRLVQTLALPSSFGTDLHFNNCFCFPRQT